ncbi:succinylglutamate desuccinylase/aspartoacylase family protein [Candidatus Nomurabacteria bacterium]|nr:succinylglutamate desuccinylase/aspartoacylase family protein [Candidatus Nomurabacteria bacterium]
MKEITKITGEIGSEYPISAIFAGVHGNEICGVNAFKELIPELKITNGVVYFVLGNPKAILQKKRFTEMNLNRVFKSVNQYTDDEKKSYEFRRGKKLKRLLKEVEVLLDIHSSMTKESVPFIICEKNADEIVKFLPAGTIVNGFDIVEPGGTDFYMNSIGKIGICIECGNHNEPNAKLVATETIKTFLSLRGHLTSGVKLKTSAQKKIQMYNLYFTQTEKFVLNKKFDDFETVKRGQIIGTDGLNQVCAPEDSIILFAQNKQKVGSEAFLLGRIIS